MLWDVFVRVIDNHGDAGVCWRLAAELAARGEQARLWIDDPSPLRWMAPAGCAGVTVVPWTDPAPRLEPGDVVIEAFGCDPPPSFVQGITARQAWLNLEYLSAEPYVERCHRLPSPVTQGPGAGLTKHFFYPGFTPDTGGLLRERGLGQRQARFDREAWLAQQGVVPGGIRLASLFCYEPAALAQLLARLAEEPTTLLVTAGRARAAVEAVLGGEVRQGALAVQYLPLLSQRDFDHLLWSCDLNFVRGEDSLVRAIWAGKPFVWQAYPQDDGAHHAKVEAFLGWLRPPPDLAEYFRVWNGISTGPLPEADPLRWRQTAELALAQGWALPELVASLLQYRALPGTAAAPTLPPADEL
ncbi:MAG: elongation factor P maturation arginine rhamnosyltransferase EarP [Burkholderiales bacterium]|nr:elongation factor P maturation arginine rhamnosyltransferase EarP [Burkholderiales bacterium]